MQGTRRKFCHICRGHFHYRIKDQDFIKSKMLFYLNSHHYLTWYVLSPLTYERKSKTVNLSKKYAFRRAFMSGKNKAQKIRKDIRSDAHKRPKPRSRESSSLQSRENERSEITRNHAKGKQKKSTPTKNDLFNTIIQ